MSEQRRLDFDTAVEAVDPLIERDRLARALATDPGRNVALEASAGTGKTRVLVDRYVRLIVEGQVHPRNILAMTFTRKAAAEMRQRVLDTLKARHREGALAGARWRAVRDAFPEITISTIDAFCLSLLHEFPLEAGVDPAFDLADETETPRLVATAIDRALRIGRGLAERDADVALVFADLGEVALRRGLAALLDRRLVAGPALHRFLHGGEMTTEEACARLLRSLREALARLPGGGRGFVGRGPVTPGFLLLASDLEGLTDTSSPPPERLRTILERLCGHVLTAEEEPRQKLAQKKADFRSDADYEAHRGMVLAIGPRVADALVTFRRELNVVMARGVQRLFAIAVTEYRRLLDREGVLDFSDVLERALALLERRDEFSRSRFKLESRYRHVLVDEFQDTSRAQWRLVRELMSAWSQGAGAADDRVPPSIFIVGDRKQSIYGFRDAEVAVLEEAARYIDALRPDLPARAAITRSHRAVLPLLRFVNDVFDAVAKQPERSDAFRYSDNDRFPVAPDAEPGSDAVGVIAAATELAQAEIVADEIARLLSSGTTVRDRSTGVRRPIGPGDVAILFRTREGHRLIEQALSARGVPFYVYKGLGFFDADEVRDVLALLAYLADPCSPLRAAALLRSRFVRVSDEALKRLAGDLPGSLRDDGPSLPEDLDHADVARLQLARTSLSEWRMWVDRLPPAELLDRILADSAYAMELAGRGLPQARENLKKLRGLVRRIQNRGYATLERIVEHFSELVAGGDESNAIIDAVDAVNLMTVHAAKGLEFPVVFVVNLGRGSGGGRDPIRVVAGDEPGSVDPMVGIGDHETEADADADARDAEESKRLLYVALTRARDRLYLAGIVDAQGRLAPAKGSLARHLPASLLEMLVMARSQPELRWTGPSAVHQLRALTGATEMVRWTAMPAEPAAPVHDFAAVEPDGVPRVAAAARSSASISADGTGAGTPSSRGLGTLVHRLLALANRQGITNRDELDRLADALADLPDVESSEGERRRAAAIAARLLASADLNLRPGARLVFEVPYSRRLDDGRVERGTIDCLTFDGDTITVLEFKTGLAQAEHSAQLGAYIESVRAAYPAHRVEGQLVYVPAS